MDTDIKRLEQKIDNIIAITASPRWLSLSHAAAYASMSKPTLIRRVQDGEIYGSLKGGKWFIDRESIDHFFLNDKVIVEETVARLRQQL